MARTPFLKSSVVIVHANGNRALQCTLKLLRYSFAPSSRTWLGTPYISISVGTPEAQQLPQGDMSRYSRAALETGNEHFA